jgi:hypothetical protein
MQDVLGLLVGDDEQAEHQLLPADLIQQQQQLLVPAVGEAECEQQQHTRTSLELARMLQQGQSEQYGLQEQAQLQQGLLPQVQLQQQVPQQQLQQQMPQQYGLQEQQQQQQQVLLPQVQLQQQVPQQQLEQQMPQRYGLQHQPQQVLLPQEHLQLQQQMPQQEPPQVLLQLQQQVPQQQMFQSHLSDGFVFGQQFQQQPQVEVLPYDSMQGAAAGVVNTSMYYTPQQQKFAATVTTGMPAAAAAGFASPFVEMQPGIPSAGAAAVAAAAGLPGDIGASLLNPPAVLSYNADTAQQQQQQQQQRPASRGSEGASSGVQDSGSSGSGAAAAAAAAAGAAVADGVKPRRRRKPSDAQREAHRRFRQRRKDLVRGGPGGWTALAPLLVRPCCCVSVGGSLSRNITVCLLVVA